MFLTNVIALCKPSFEFSGYSEIEDVDKPVESVENLMFHYELYSFFCLNIFVDFVKLFIKMSTMT